MSKKYAPLFTRLLSNTEVTFNDCWEWQGARNNAGYGFIRDGKRMRLTHRVSYELHNDCIVPDDVMIGHTCFNYVCVNPAHLFPGTRQQIVDNMLINERHSKSPRHVTPHRRITCPHCGVEGPVNTHHVWHMDKCKHKPKA